MGDVKEDLSQDFDDDDDGYEPKGKFNGSTENVGTKGQGFEIDGMDKSDVKYNQNVASNAFGALSNSREKLDVNNDEKAIP